MRKIKEFLRPWFTQGAAIGILLLILAFQPMMDLDYLIYPYLNQFGLPRPSTIVRYLLIPALIVRCFYNKNKNRRKTLILGGLYIVVFVVYFLIHVQVTRNAAALLRLPSNFQFSLFGELVYCLTLIIPLGLIAAFTTLQVNEKLLKQITAILSATISFPILISDLFVFGQSTYLGNTAASFFSWFTGIYETVEPRRLACKYDWNSLVHAAAVIVLFLFSEQGTKGKNFLGNADRRSELVHVDFVDAGGVAGLIFDPDHLCRTLPL